MQASIWVQVCVLLARDIALSLTTPYNTMQVHVFIFVQWWDWGDVGNEHGGEGHMLGNSPPHHHHQHCPLAHPHINTCTYNVLHHQNYVPSLHVHAGVVCDLSVLWFLHFDVEIV